MKRILPLFLILLALALPALAEQEAADAEDAAPGVTRTLEIKKGTAALTTRTNIVGVKGTRRKSLWFQVQEVTNLGTGKVTDRCLRISYLSQNGEYSATLDPVEIDAAIATIRYIEAHVGRLNDFSDIRYSTNNRSRRFDIGLSYSGEKQKDLELYFCLNSNYDIAVPYSRLNEVIEAFQTVKALL